MARRRHRDPDPQIRDRNRWDATGQPAVGGLSRIGGGSRGGGTNLVVRGGGQPGQVRIEHITLLAEASQTIASGGAGITWDRYADAPTEIRGFATAADQLAATGSIVAIPVPLDGPGVLAIDLRFSEAITATVSLVRTRWGVETELASQSGTGDQFFGAPHLSDLMSIDTVELRITHSESGTSYSDAGTGYSDVAGAYSSGAATVSWGRLQFTQWGLASPTSRALPSSYEALVLSHGPLGYWKFDESSGSTAVDASGNGYDLTYQGSPALGASGVMQDGSGATAVDFDGSTDGAAGSDWSAFEFTGTAAFTVEAWLVIDTLPSAGSYAQVVQKQISGSGAGWEFVLAGTTQQIEFNRTDGNPAVGTGTLAAGTVYHVVGTCHPTDGMKMYLNGALMDSSAAVGAMSGNSVALSVGYDSDGTAYRFDGTLDEVAIYDRALSAAEVNQHWVTGTKAA